MKITARQIDFVDGAPDGARQTRDHPDEVIRIIHRDRVTEAVKVGGDPEQAIHRNTTALLYLRYTKAMCYAVCLFVDTEMEGPSQVYYGTAGGGGYDKAAAALSGMPIAMMDGEPIVLTDHCGLDHRDDNPFPGKREITAHRGSSNLPPFLFTI
jgi:hypothetical protein